MPTFGMVISKTLGLSPSLSVGLILLACCPGGAASNVVRVSLPITFFCSTIYLQTLLEGPLAEVFSFWKMPFILVTDIWKSSLIY